MSKEDNKIQIRLANLERDLENLENIVSWFVVSYCKQELAIKAMQDESIGDNYENNVL
tara:strand:- start:332 stop:505 length:174 start_codon:yes stop_codon:yes gene_type:complete